MIPTPTLPTFTLPTFTSPTFTSPTFTSPTFTSKAARLLVPALLSLALAGCGCSGSLVVHAFDKTSGDPVDEVEVRVEEAGLSARGESSARLNEVPCREQEYLIHVSSPAGHFAPQFARGAIQGGGVVSVEVQVELNAAGLAAKQREAELRGDPLGRLKDSAERLIPR